MKKLIIRLLCLFALTAFAVSCNKEVSFEKIEIQKTEVTADSAECNIDLQFLCPVRYGNEKALAQLQQNLLALIFGDEYKDVCIKKAAEQYASAILDEFQLNAQGLESLSYAEEWIINTAIVYNTGNLLSYEVSRYVFTGGAHGLETRECYLFDMKTGNRINQFEIFTEESKDEISAMLKAKIMSDNGFADEGKMVESGFLFPEKIVPNNNFCVTDSSLIYLFNPYEIAAGALGSTQVELSFEAIKPFVVKDNPICKLIK